MKETQIAGQTVGGFVALDYRTAAVFEKYGIDFCCQGNRRLKDVCERQQLSVEQILMELDNISKNYADKTDYWSWPLDKLVAHIQSNHHGYVEKQIPILKLLLCKICEVHGEGHPELAAILSLFNQSADELTIHMKKEEMILFPFIRRIVNAKKETTVESPQFDSVENPVEMLKHDHDGEGERFRKIRELSKDFYPPEDACNTYKLTYAMLREFEQDLHLHIHLENNILFPKTIDLDKMVNNC